ncbi:hypothetical protein DFH08DRAFT_805488 [Mycena albidolilacea]|uniref:Uncharacterized protein n=1 Tax=Mycena albidolilacea TaxID=1033008 RepID=A0AAD7EUN4_9AGAR|nr:hypothetical protein DFH08DRAFT_805488 [Mycena albidolilacea]
MSDKVDACVYRGWERSECFRYILITSLKTSNTRASGEQHPQTVRQNQAFGIFLHRKQHHRPSFELSTTRSVAIAVLVLPPTYPDLTPNFLTQVATTRSAVLERALWRCEHLCCPGRTCALVDDSKVRDIRVWVQTAMLVQDGIAVEWIVRCRRVHAPSRQSFKHTTQLMAAGGSAERTCPLTNIINPFEALASRSLELCWGKRGEKETSWPTAFPGPILPVHQPSTFPMSIRSYLQSNIYPLNNTWPFSSMVKQLPSTVAVGSTPGYSMSQRCSCISSLWRRYIVKYISRSEKEMAKRTEFSWDYYVFQPSQSLSEQFMGRHDLDKILTPNGGLSSGGIGPPAVPYIRVGARAVRRTVYGIRPYNDGGHTAVWPTVPVP